MVSYESWHIPDYKSVRRVSNFGCPVDHGGDYHAQIKKYFSQIYEWLTCYFLCKTINGVVAFKCTSKNHRPNSNMCYCKSGEKDLIYRNLPIVSNRVDCIICGTGMLY